MNRTLIAILCLAGVAFGGVALAAQQPAPKPDAKQETRKETRSDPCEPEASKKSATPAKKGVDAKTSGSREPTKR